MLRSLLMGAICLLWTSIVHTQTDYYWTNDKQISLEKSNTHFIINTEEANTLRNVNTNGLKKYENWAHKSYAVVESETPTTSNELITNLGFDSKEVSVSPGYVLSD